MKVMFIVSLLTFFSLPSCAIELVCRDRQPQDPRQRIVFVDCADRTGVIEALGSAWRTLRNENAGRSAEDKCLKSYNRASEVRAVIWFDDIAMTLFLDCNKALSKVH